jgi:predicted  nucleic acid-binding Zn-ribbon protein
MEKEFQLKMNLTQQQNEGNNDALQKEIKALKEKLARAQPEMEDIVSSDLNYDTVCTLNKNDDDDINTTSKLTVTERNSDALQKEATTLKQKEREQHEENQPLKERLARMEAGV